MERKPVIAIDGHSSCGKSTVAKAVAKHLGYTYIDTGAMYRAVTLYALEHKMISESRFDIEQLVNNLDDIKITFHRNDEKLRNEIYLNNRVVEDRIRELDVSNQVSRVSEISKVRRKMVQLQREIAKEGGVVMDGRDIGTVVFPDADLKIFMTADEKVRAKRRYNELTEKGMKASFEDVLQNIKTRDYIDQNREDSPLKKADDAIVLDNTTMTRDEQLQFVLSKIHELK